MEGFDIRDYCGDVNLAVTSSMDFIEASSSAVSTSHCSNTEVATRSDVMKAVIGPSNSDAALSVASLFNLFKLPEVSPLATSTELSDKRYSYFLRTVPSDNSQMIALADIVQHFQWSSIIVLSTDDIAYGIKGSELLVNQLQARNVCVAYQARFNVEFTDSDFQDIINNLRKLSNITVLVSIADAVAMARLLDVFAQNEMFGYTWLASEGWSWSPMLAEEKYYKVVQGMLGVSVPFNSDSAFIDYLQNLKVVDCQDPFLTQYWEQTHNCYLTTRSKRVNVSACTGNETFASDDPFLREALVSSVMDSVKVVAYGLEACGISTDSEDLLECMKEVNFTNDGSYRILFKENGDLASYARYDIINVPSSDCQLSFTPKLIGRWTENNGLYINESTIFWSAPDSNCDQIWKGTSDSITPKSFCSADCDFGYRQQIDRENNCCWECIPCLTGEYSNTTNALKCIKCKDEEMTNSSKNGCQKLPYFYLTPKTNFIALTMCIVASVGCMFTLCLVLFYVVKQRSTVVYFSCGEVFKFPLLVSIICCFFFSTFSFTPTTPLSCAVSAIIQLLPIILSQINLMCMCLVHRRNSENEKQYSAWILLIIILSYFCLMGIGFIIKNPNLAKEPDPVNSVLSIGCLFTGMINCYTLAIFYIMTLDTVGIIFSYRIRTKEGNFNEAKFIFYTFISHAMLWIAILLVYIVVGNHTHSKQLTIACGMICSAYVVLACIFVPKLHAYNRKAEARTIVKHTKCRKKFRRRRNALNDSHIWSEVSQNSYKVFQLRIKTA
ncbi:extracellular calcium-sensing receptor-like [Anneissia japonica]|uniref:extracellular calcium-sensing receptor-like n=1 Tax=Anneissia japonica TaxID=1529436 RepID=UPI0014259077|nr:extracellular calcium-sensing receptor-like [Anneissia japonica]